MLSQRSIGAAGKGGLPSDDEFNRVSFLSHFDGTNNGTNNVFDDGSASNHTITTVGNVTQGSFGPFARDAGNWSVDYTATDSPYTKVLSDGTNLGAGTGAYTVEAWINWSEWEGTNQRIWLMGRAGADFIVLGKNADENRLFTNSDTIDYDFTPNLGQWYHIAVVRASTGTNGLSLYIDGTRVAQGQLTNSVDAEDFYVSGLDWASGYNLRGKASNFRYTKSAVYSGASFTVPDGPLTAIANTEILMCQDNRFVDNSIRARAISIGGSPSVSSSGPFLTSEVYDPAVNGASAYFDGNGDYLKNTNNNTDLQFGTGDLTVEFWLYLNQIGVVQYPFDTRQAPNGDGGGIQVAILANNTMWVDMDGAGITLQTSLTLKANEWTHVAFTRASGTWRFFFNGVLNSGTGSDSGNITGGYLSIGTSATRNTADTDDKIKGYMSDVRAVKGTAVYTSAFTPPTAPLTAITNTTLLLNMADGQAIDSAAQKEWTATTVYDGTPKLQTAQKKMGTSSLYFDGSSGYYFPSGFLPDGTGDFTVEFWFRASILNDNATILVAGDSVFYQIYQSNLYYWNGASSRIISGTISNDTWYHVAGVRSGTTIYLFLNGTSQGTLTGITGSVTAGAGYMGGNQGGNKYTGYIDEMRISRFARYTSNFTPATEPFADKGE